MVVWRATVPSDPASLSEDVERQAQCGMFGGAPSELRLGLGP